MPTALTLLDENADRPRALRGAFSTVVGALELPFAERALYRTLCISTDLAKGGRRGAAVCLPTTEVEVALGLAGMDRGERSCTEAEFRDRSDMTRLRVIGRVGEGGVVDAFRARRTSARQENWMGVSRCQRDEEMVVSSPECSDTIMALTSSMEDARLNARVGRTSPVGYSRGVGMLRETTASIEEVCIPTSGTS